MLPQVLAGSRLLGDNPTMTLTADEKGRLTCRELFPPRAAFDAHKDELGRVVLTRLAKQEHPPKLVKPIRYKDGWLMPREVNIDKLVEEINQERQAQDENLLG
jgi:hypothetical protein